MLLRRYLKAALRNFGNADNAPEARIITLLFFGSEDLPVGMRSPGELLDEARKQTGRTDDEFRKLQHVYFHQLADFLIGPEDAASLAEEAYGATE